MVARASTPAYLTNACRGKAFGRNRVGEPHESPNPSIIHSNLTAPNLFRKPPCNQAAKSSKTNPLHDLCVGVCTHKKIHHSPNLSGEAPGLDPGA